MSRNREMGHQQTGFVADGDPPDIEVCGFPPFRDETAKGWGTRHVCVGRGLHEAYSGSLVQSQGMSRCCSELRVAHSMMRATRQESMGAVGAGALPSRASRMPS